MLDFSTFFFEQAKTALGVCGQRGRFTFVHDVQRLNNNKDIFYGNLIAKALLIGYPGPRYLIPCVVHRILGFIPNQASLDDIPDFEIAEN